MGGGVSDIFRFTKCEMSAAVFVKFSAYAESERNFALNARSSLRSNFTRTEGCYFTRRKANFVKKRPLSFDNGLFGAGNRT